MILPHFLMPPDQVRRAYAHLFDLVHEPGSRAYARGYAKGLTEWQAEREPRMRRLKWCLAHIHTQEELEEMVLARLGEYGLDDIPPHPMEASGAYEKDADLCDVIIFSDLNLSYGERMGIEHFDSAAEAKEFADGHERSVGYSDGEGGWIVVYDVDPSD